MGTITKENAQTKSEIAAILFAHKLEDFHTFTNLAEKLLDRYSEIIWQNQFGFRY